MEKSEPGFKINQKVLAFIIALVVVGGSITSWVSQFNQIGTNEANITTLDSNQDEFIKITFESFKSNLNKEFEKRETKAVMYIDNIVLILKNEMGVINQRLTKKIDKQDRIIEKIEDLRVDVEKLKKDVEHLKK